MYSNKWKLVLTSFWNLTRQLTSLLLLQSNIYGNKFEKSSFCKEKWYQVPETLFIRMFSCLLNVWIILKLNAEQVNDETVVAHIPSSTTNTPQLFLWHMPSLYPTFNILTCLNISLVKFKLLLNWYYLLTSFLHKGYLEKCVTMRIYPRNCFVPLPALTDAWNWALRPQH